MTLEKAALKAPSAIDTRALIWTFDRLDEDHELERFFFGLPDFHSSKVLKEPLRGLDDQQKLSLLEAVIRLLDRTFSSNSLPDQVKRQRADICANAINLVDTPGAYPIIVHRLASEGRYGPAQSTEIVASVRQWGNRKGEVTTLAQAAFSIVVARVQRHDDSWFILASNELGIPETVLREYARHGDSLSLAILIHVTRQQFIHIRNPFWPSHAISNVLKAASEFNAQDTSPELQHEFCALWNQVVRLPIRLSRIPEHILTPIRKPYIALHQNTNSAPTGFSSSTGDDNVNLAQVSSYPVCTVTSHVHNTSAFATSPHTVPHYTAMSPTSLASPVASSFPFPSPLQFHADESLRGVSPLDNSHPTRQTFGSSHVPFTSPDQATAGATQGVVTLDITPSYPIPDTSISASLGPSNSPPAAVYLQHIANPLTPPTSLNLPSSASNTVLGNIFPTDSHRPIILTTAPSASPGPSSAPELGNTAEDDGRPKFGMHKEMDALELRSVNCPVNASTMATLDLPPQSMSPSSATNSDVAVASRSLQESKAEPSGHHSPDPSSYQDDIV